MSLLMHPCQRRLPLRRLRLLSEQRLPGGVVSFAADETEKTISVGVSQDKKFEPDETFRVILSEAIRKTALALKSQPVKPVWTCC